MTKGYFERPFCKLELQTAIQLERKIVLVHETRPDLGGHASFGDYMSEFKEQTKDGKLYADFPEAKQIFNVDSVPLYHEATLDPISVKRILARIGVAEPPSNAALLAAAMRVPQGARLAVLSSGSGTRQAETAAADMRRVCPAMACTFSSADKAHVVVVFVTRGVPEELGNLVASLLTQGRRVIALYQVDERKGYDGVRHEDLASDARWQDVPLVPWVVYRDFREAALARIRWRWRCNIAPRRSSGRSAALGFSSVRLLTCSASAATCVSLRMGQESTTRCGCHGLTARTGSST